MLYAEHTAQNTIPLFDVCREPTPAGHHELHPRAPESGGGVGPPAAGAARAALRVCALPARARLPAEARAGLQPARCEL